MKLSGHYNSRRPSGDDATPQQQTPSKGNKPTEKSGGSKSNPSGSTPKGSAPEISPQPNLSGPQNTRRDNSMATSLPPGVETSRPTLYEAPPSPKSSQREAVREEFRDARLKRNEVFANNGPHSELSPEGRAAQREMRASGKKVEQLESIPSAPPHWGDLPLAKHNPAGLNQNTLLNDPQSLYRPASHLDAPVDLSSNAVAGPISHGRGGYDPRLTAQSSNPSVPHNGVISPLVETSRSTIYEAPSSPTEQKREILREEYTTARSHRNTVIGGEGVSDSFKTLTPEARAAQKNLDQAKLNMNQFEATGQMPLRAQDIEIDHKAPVDLQNARPVPNPRGHQGFDSRLMAPPQPNPNTRLSRLAPLPEE
jgi:hypothetical protein